jgi:hypothetical protein
LRQYLSQYYFNEDTQYHLARSYALFTRYWNDNEYSKTLGIDVLYQSITGFSIKEATLFGTILSKNSRKGLIKYTEPKENFRSRLLRSDADPLRQPLFFQWFSQTCSSYRDEIQTGQNENYLDKYQKNPLLSKPLVIPEHSFYGSYLVPIPILLALQSHQESSIYLETRILAVIQGIFEGSLVECLMITFMIRSQGLEPYQTNLT